MKAPVRLTIPQLRRVAERYADDVPMSRLAAEHGMGPGSLRRAIGAAGIALPVPKSQRAREAMLTRAIGLYDSSREYNYGQIADIIGWPRSVHALRKAVANKRARHADTYEVRHHLPVHAKNRALLMWETDMGSLGEIAKVVGYNGTGASLRKVLERHREKLDRTRVVAPLE